MRISRHCFQECPLAGAECPPAGTRRTSSTGTSRPRTSCSTGPATSRCDVPTGGLFDNSLVILLEHICDMAAAIASSRVECWADGQKHSGAAVHVSCVPTGVCVWEPAIARTHGATGPTS